MSVVVVVFVVVAVTRLQFQIHVCFIAIIDVSHPSGF